MKKAILILALMFMSTSGHADVVEFTDKTIEVGLEDTTYASVYFGKGRRGYSVIVSVKPYSDDIYKKWTKWTSKGNDVGTNLDFVSTIDIDTGAMTFDRDACRISMSPGNNRYAGWIKIRCAKVDEGQWVEAREDFNLYDGLVGGWLKKWPAYDYYVKARR